MGRFALSCFSLLSHNPGQQRRERCCSQSVGICYVNNQDTPDRHIYRPPLSRQLLRGYKALADWLLQLPSNTSSSKLRSFQSFTWSIRDLSKSNVFFPPSFLSSLTPTPFSLPLSFLLILFFNIVHTVVPRWWPLTWALGIALLIPRCPTWSLGLRTGCVCVGGGG